MDFIYRFLTLGIPWTQSMPSCDVNAATLLAEVSWKCDRVFNKVYGVDVQSPTFFRENGKLWNLNFRPKFSKPWIHQIAHLKYWIINDLTKNASVMVWYKRKYKSTVAYMYLRHRPSSFWKTVDKKWWDFILSLKKATNVRILNQGHQKSV